MEQEWIKLFGALGALIFLVVGAIKFGVQYGLKAIEKLYADMQLQHKEQVAEIIKQKEQVMEYLNKKNETDSKIADTLENISQEMQCINIRVDKIEKTIETR